MLSWSLRISITLKKIGLSVENAGKGVANFFARI